MPHAWQRFQPLPEARKSLDDAAAFLRAAAEGRETDTSADPVDSAAKCSARHYAELELRPRPGAAVRRFTATAQGAAADDDGHSMAATLAVRPPRLLAVDNERYTALHPNIWEPDVGAASKDSRRQHLRPSSKTGKPYRVYWS